ncbi:hypothetical protein B0H16DRAFT_1899782 [Mycena metata]|uniref:Uncharacterized protein n=1 Tax=Mycena metata TaxID=1033252 RepID=A0AAD7H5V9_9AGAR|nr:hypothetical protein B0H16DRAFT_1899782 [Mycena metata]
MLPATMRGRDRCTAAAASWRTPRTRHNANPARTARVLLSSPLRACPCAHSQQADDAVDGGNERRAPGDRSSREQDYALRWRHGVRYVRRRGTSAPLGERRIRGCVYTLYFLSHRIPFHDPSCDPISLLCVSTSPRRLRPLLCPPALVHLRLLRGEAPSALPLPHSALVYWRTRRAGPAPNAEMVVLLPRAEKVVAAAHRNSLLPARLHADSTLLMHARTVPHCLLLLLSSQPPRMRILIHSPAGTRRDALETLTALSERSDPLRIRRLHATPALTMRASEGTRAPVLVRPPPLLLMPSRRANAFVCAVCYARPRDSNMRAQIPSMSARAPASVSIQAVESLPTRAEFSPADSILYRHPHGLGAAVHSRLVPSQSPLLFFCAGVLV